MTKTEGSDTITMEFTYNHAGLRTKKVKKVNGITKESTEYILNGKNVVELIHTNHATNTINRLHFFYDAQSRVALVDFNGTLYSYAHNLQGDVIGILDSSVNLVVEYKYDAWGKPISVTGTLTTTLGELNPFRYRGYVWDQETELYYLRSRYYSSNFGRFINSDKMYPHSYVFCNTFSYCSNNPINYVDHSGFYPEYPNKNVNYNMICEAGVCGGVALYVGIAFGDLVVKSTESVGSWISDIWRTIWRLDAVEKSTSQAKTVTNTNEYTDKYAAHTQPPKLPARFPADPSEFTPYGLELRLFGTGKIAKWIIPNTKIAIFEWNYQTGDNSHYHVMLPSMKNHHLEGHHYYAGDLIPEPWSSIFFGETIYDSPWDYLE